MVKTTRVLSTKLLNEVAIARLAEAGLEVIAQSFIHIDILDHISLPKVQRADAIITSANAVKALSAIRHRLPAFQTIYCIAGRTEALVRETFDAELIARPYASALLEILVAAPHKYPLWFFKGNKALPTIPEGLQHAGIPFEAIEVYQNKATPVVLESDFDAVLFFSPSAVESFLQDNIIPDNTITFAIGTTTAKALKPFAKRLVISKEPTEASIIDAVLEYFNL